MHSPAGEPSEIVCFGLAQFRINIPERFVLDS